MNDLLKKYMAMEVGGAILIVGYLLFFILYTITRSVWLMLLGVTMLIAVIGFGIMKFVYAVKIINEKIEEKGKKK